MQMRISHPAEAFLIRVAALQDLGSILAIQQAALESAQWPAATYAAIISPSERGSSHRRAVFVATEGGCVIGFAVVAAIQMEGTAECELENMAIDPKFRRRGVGRRLVERVMTWGAEQKTLQVLLEVRSSNATARKLYETMGFRSVGRRPAYYAQPVEDAILMAFLPRQHPK